MADSDDGSNDGFLLGDLLFQNARPEDLRIDRIQMDDLFTVNQSINLSVRRLVRPSIHPSACLSVYMSH